MRTTLRLIIPLALILAVIGPGCYTVVMHPSDEGGYRADQTSDCLRCHDSYHDYPYGYYYSPYPSWWWNYSNYSSYYAYPWWWRYYDYPYLDGGYHYSDGGGSAHRGTKFDRRGTGPAPPPHSWSTWNDNQPSQPSIIDQTQDAVTGGQNQTSQGRPNVGTDDSGARTKDENAGTSDSKVIRQTTVRQAAPQDNSTTTTKPAETKNTKKSRTKKP
jgi:hypothetical protein